MWSATSTNLAILAALFLLSSCVSISDEAAQVQVHHQMSNLLAECKRLGPVTGQGSRAISYGHAQGTAEAEMRQSAAELGGDSVVILNTDAYTMRVVMQGIAFRCY